MENPRRNLAPRVVAGLCILLFLAGCTAPPDPVNSISHGTIWTLSVMELPPPSEFSPPQYENVTVGDLERQPISSSVFSEMRAASAPSRSPQLSEEEAAKVEKEIRALQESSSQNWSGFEGELFQFRIEGETQIYRYSLGLASS